ncbi:hypothetical protein JI58_03905 [Marinosulfonomonas sp. PRT-SC04]|nr:hypothetical protein JI58_03905 [Marinosulfonomonas sp. PRT-SC04]
MRVNGFQVEANHSLGHLAVLHDGEITWDDLQAVKNAVWGEDANAIEVYPAQSRLVNSLNCRHLWRLGANDFCPDLLGQGQERDTLERRFCAAWNEAWSQHE